jgi:hypothetical protein
VADEEETVPVKTRREELQDLLEEITEYVYFQPPSGFQMKYPCIVYILDDMNTRFADNAPYTVEKRYQLTVIDRDPNSMIPDSVALLPKCIFDRYFPSSGLNHYVFQIFY